MLVCVLSGRVCFQMFDWILHNKGLFLTSYTEIGGSHTQAAELQTQHNHFAMNCMVRPVLYPNTFSPAHSFLHSHEHTREDSCRSRIRSA